MALISTADAAKRTGLSRAHIRDLMIRGELKGKKLGNSWAVDDASVEIYLTTRPMQARNRVLKTLRRRN